MLYSIPFAIGKISKTQTDPLSAYPLFAAMHWFSGAVVQISAVAESRLSF
jgi:hypothetical protein